jgi:hypothetical protein
MSSSWSTSEATRVTLASANDVMMSEKTALLSTGRQMADRCPKMCKTCMKVFRASQSSKPLPSCTNIILLLFFIDARVSVMKDTVDAVGKHGSAQLLEERPRTPTSRECTGPFQQIDDPHHALFHLAGERTQMIKLLGQSACRLEISHTQVLTCQFRNWLNSQSHTKPSHMLITLLDESYIFKVQHLDPKLVTRLVRIRSRSSRSRSNRTPPRAEAPTLHLGV